VCWNSTLQKWVGNEKLHLTTVIITTIRLIIIKIIEKEKKKTVASSTCVGQKRQLILVDSDMLVREY